MKNKTQKKKAKGYAVQRWSRALKRRSKKGVRRSSKGTDRDRNCGGDKVREGEAQEQRVFDQKEIGNMEADTGLQEIERGFDKDTLQMRQRKDSRACAEKKRLCSFNGFATGLLSASGVQRPKTMFGFHIFWKRPRIKMNAVAKEIIRFLEELGLLVNQEKSQLKPRGRFSFLGFEWDSSKMKVWLARDRREALTRLCRRWEKDCMKARIVKVKDLASFIGKLNAVRNKGKRMERQIEVECFNPAADSAMDIEVESTPKTQAYPSIFPGCNSFNGCIGDGLGSISSLVQPATRCTQSVPQPNEEAIVQFQRTNGSISFSEWNARKRLQPVLRKLWRLKQDLGIELRASHVPGVLNTRADALSRLERAGDYEVQDEECEKIMTKLNIAPTLDAFAAQLNRKVGRWCGVGSQLAEDGLMFPWKNEVVLAHPPIPLVIPTIQKARQERAQVI
ncbi:uncharacterized protein MONOS_8785 [Monocercomonoides exilis]|uniref:uncharacterized protein n=1 Tax=Monocercomonoides exilis TaxID=2049356 RepID=UPI00355A5742|nr:hypothetical protein MONOS_8785 [Monocercomonoides exilis]|eukprot:MONOS_8785.1-p1 / transcript=MONOS_8785.1 / gene=MONOS_8785 / organism=Monocercomonoides_exilis_PA203 / gene_product=unspecified product / transcript_product=unspecified product / location=Mono_scaffold00341:27069-28707(-) / protein_length=449 / sequence_SO=supercontig / SO=protein_coding / is_pseudo=false